MSMHSIDLYKIATDPIPISDRYRFTIQVGRYRGSYKTRHRTDNLHQALLMYAGINIGNGYKKRLIDNGKVIARNFS